MGLRPLAVRPPRRGHGSRPHRRTRRRHRPARACTHALRRRPRHLPPAGMRRPVRARPHRRSRLGAPRRRVGADPGSGRRVGRDGRRCAEGAPVATRRHEPGPDEPACRPPRPRPRTCGRSSRARPPDGPRSSGRPPGATPPGWRPTPPRSACTRSSPSATTCAQTSCAAGSTRPRASRRPSRSRPTGWRRTPTKPGSRRSSRWRRCATACTISPPSSASGCPSPPPTRSRRPRSRPAAASSR